VRADTLGRFISGVVKGTTDCTDFRDGFQDEKSGNLQ
jgi:hypothetical protein